MHYPRWMNPGAYESDACEAPSRMLIESISLTAELCGKALSPAAAELLANDLADFDEGAVLAALSRCRKELQGPLKLHDILVHIDDGRPDADEAWAMMPRSELTSVVWTDEMAQAWGVALPMLNAGDAGGARAAFRDTYAKAVLEARIRHTPPHWTPSLGSDVTSRKRVLLEALEKHRLSAAHVEQLLPVGVPTAEAKEIMARLEMKSLH